MDRYRRRPELSERFQLGAVGPFEFQGKFAWTNGPFAFFQGNLHGPMALKVRQKFPPSLALVRGWLFPEIIVKFRQFWAIVSRSCKTKTGECLSLRKVGRTTPNTMVSF